jgi:hypothetical protein
LFEVILNIFLKNETGCFLLQSGDQCLEKSSFCTTFNFEEYCKDPENGAGGSES